ncbi:twist-related protein-like [Homarus americanus]|uniref:twist-related protein-like n=1 Tax=Homarus americanus TaxID=6706 RepID=UPI001C487345|nr:twist-related protein-like [Homarus americanus]XP_042237092.1 twist-related protein-like [Homarus americanus]
MITGATMAKAEHQVTVQEQVVVSVDDNNNDSNNNNNKCSEDESGISGGKYQLRPRSVKSRRRCDSDWNFQDTLRHKPRPPPLSRYRRKTANARERYRMRQINTAFDSLRGVLPSWVCSRRAASDMTKITTLKLASAYIRSLQDILDGNAHQDTCSWVLSSILDEASSSPQQPQPVHYNPSITPSKTHQPPAHTTTDSELVSLLCGASDSSVFQDNLESFSYLSPAGDTDTVTLLLLGADPPRCWGEAQHTLPVS